MMAIQKILNNIIKKNSKTDEQANIEADEEERLKPTEISKHKRRQIGTTNDIQQVQVLKQHFNIRIQE